MKKKKKMSEPELDADKSTADHCWDYFQMLTSTAVWGLLDYMVLLGVHHLRLSCIRQDGLQSWKGDAASVVLHALQHYIADVALCTYASTKETLICHNEMKISEKTERCCVHQTNHKMQRLLSLMLWKTQFRIWISPSYQSWRNRVNYSIFHHCTSISFRKQTRSLMAIEFMYDSPHSISICRSRFKVNSSGN